MGRSYFLTILLISAVLVLSFSRGLVRKEMRFGEGASFNKLDVVNSEKEGRVMMMESTMDYQEPGANTNPRNGFTLTPPPGSSD